MLPFVLVLGCTPADSSGGTGGGINATPECHDFCDLRLTCDPEEDPEDPVAREACLIDCTASFYSAASWDQQICPMLLQRVYQCVNVLDTCDAFDQWLDQTPADYPCVDEETEYCLQCGGC